MRSILDQPLTYRMLKGSWEHFIWDFSLKRGVWVSYTPHTPSIKISLCEYGTRLSYISSYILRTPLGYH